MKTTLNFGSTYTLPSNETNCAICLNELHSQPSCQEEEGKTLDCSHIFHRECIGEWLKHKHNCPLCRAPVEVNTTEATTPEMTTEEILAVPDVSSNYSASIGSESFAETLSSVRNTIQNIRLVRQIHINENTPQCGMARKANSIAARIFGFGQ